MKKRGKSEGAELTAAFADAGRVVWEPGPRQRIVPVGRQLLVVNPVAGLPVPGDDSRLLVAAGRAVAIVEVRPDGRVSWVDGAHPRDWPPGERIRVFGLLVGELVDLPRGVAA